MLNELWGVGDPAEVERRAAAGEGLRSEDVAEAIVFMLTRPRNVTIREPARAPALPKTYKSLPTFLSPARALAKSAPRR